MKRYEVVHNFTRAPDGDYIRHDDADLAALVAALRAYLVAEPQCQCSEHSGCTMASARAGAQRALSAFAAASGTTTRGGGEA